MKWWLIAWREIRWEVFLDRASLLRMLVFVIIPMLFIFSNRRVPAGSAGDLTLASIHWGSNWGYDIPDEQVRFAHRLVEAGVDLVHGHSSHHLKAIEAYRERLILYGCGDFINDYEGIHGHEQYRGDLALLYFATVDPGGGDLVQLRMTPMQLRKLALNRASARDASWLGSTLARASADFGSWIEDGLSAENER